MKANVAFLDIFDTRIKQDLKKMKEKKKKKKERLILDLGHPLSFHVKFMLRLTTSYSL